MKLKFKQCPSDKLCYKIWTKLVYTRAHLVYWQINSIEISWHLMKESANNVNSEKCKEISLLSKAKVLIWYALLTFLTKKKFNFDIRCNYCKTDRLSRKKKHNTKDNLFNAKADLSFCGKQWQKNCLTKKNPTYTMKKIEHF